ncbi:MAG TPA: hypothetical protein DCW29_00965 [Janthinobacterium sp.]|nr:hypothetical protein [Janthinobacterium sp.]
MAFWRTSLSWRGGAFLAALLASAGAAAAPPSTFGTIVGNAVLCLDEVDNAYFYDYLTTAFGPYYKHEGGAFWFKADAALWGAPVNDVIVSDDTSALTFLGVVADLAPDKLEEAIVAASGLHFVKSDASAFPVRESRPGSKIVFFRSKSKVYCAKYKPLAPGLK